MTRALEAYTIYMLNNFYMLKSETIAAKFENGSERFKKRISNSLMNTVKSALEYG